MESEIFVAIAEDSTKEVNVRAERLNLRLLAAQVLNYIPGSILPAFISLISAAIFTRVFSALEYGQYSLVMSVITSIVAISSQWLQQAINRYLPAVTNEKERRWIKQVTAVGFVLTCLFLVGVSIPTWALVVITLPSQWQRFILPAILFVVAMSAFNSVSVVLQAEMQARRFSYFSLANAAGKLVLSIVIVFTISREPAGMVWGAALSTILLLPILWYRADMPALKTLRREEWPNYWADIKRLATYGFPMIGWFLAATLLNVGDRYVIQWFRGSTEVGIYSANYSLINGAAGLVAAPLLLAAHPFLMRAWGEGDKINAGKWLGTIAEWILQAGIVLIGATCLFSSDIATWFLGVEFRSGHIVMPIVIAGVVTWQLGMYAHKPLEFSERTKLMFILSLAVAVLNLVLNIIFVPKFGYLAAAYTTLVSFIVYTITTSVVGQRFLQWRVNFRSVGVTILATAITVVSLTKLRQLFEHTWGYAPGFLITLVCYTVTVIIVLRLVGLDFRKLFIQLRR